MLLKLSNFKCWKDKSLIFNDNGLTLISGSSGKGKTSILEAINFVLFGKGRKIITHGSKKRCCVI